MLDVNKAYHGDCLDLMKSIDDKSIDMILCDLPYGTTQCNWDTIIPLDKLWEQYKRIIKNDSVIILTASQPFTSILVSSNLKWFKYEWVWEKSKASNFLSSKKQPLKAHENILVFLNGKTPYNPIMTVGTPFKGEGRRKKNELWEGMEGKRVSDPTFVNDNNGTRYPRSVQYFKTAESEGRSLHPTQKPIELFEYLMKTYSKEGDLILDNCAGSGTTGIAAINTNRNFILMEKDENYFDVINERLTNHINNY